MKKRYIWGAWFILTMALGLYFGNKLYGQGDKSTFLVGPATHGHYQIEMACETCHTSPFGGTEVLQNACTQCHAQELEDAHDSHPKSKFTNPRNADRVAILDARWCVTCHTEHQQEQTRAMGVTLPDDYCYYCHKELGDERPSHKDLAFDSCASAGCHNYHDNRALYEDFLIEHAHEPWLTQQDLISSAVSTSFVKATSVLVKHEPVTLTTTQFPRQAEQYTDIGHEWETSSHAQAGVDCGGCHTDKQTQQWLDKPNHEQCRNCHTFEVKGFLAGKHGMRLSADVSASLTPVTPSQSHMPFKAEAHNISHGCSTCHSAHDFNPQQAAVEGCLNCHSDDHSLAFQNSPHGQLWQQSLSDPQITPVTCASCHMPRTKINIKGEQVMAVQHNQNDNLRPNEKMIRPVCMNCHGLGFAIDALADPELIHNNFTGQPSRHIESIDWALKRIEADEETQ